jgi:hypothetical protein
LKVREGRGDHAVEGPGENGGQEQLVETRFPKEVNSQHPVQSKTE